MGPMMMEKKKKKLKEVNHCVVLMAVEMQLVMSGVDKWIGGLSGIWE